MDRGSMVRAISVAVATVRRHRRGTKQQEWSRRQAQDQHRPEMPERQPKQRDEGERWREEPARYATAEAEDGGERLQQEQPEDEQRRAELAGDRELRQVFAVPEQLRKRDRRCAKQTQHEERRDQPQRTSRLVTVGPQDQPDVGRGGHSHDRPRAGSIAARRGTMCV